MRQLFLITISFFTVFSVQAQEHALRGPDETPYTTMDQYTDFLDSMVQHWYFKKYNDLKNREDEESVWTGEGEVFSDSLVTERLKAIPTVFPLKYNDKVANWIRLYVYRNRRSPYLIGMTDYYFPIFEEVLDKYRLPLELKYIPIIESALNPEARSRAGAVGLWQFMYSTGKMYGLEVNSYVDERMDPIKSTHAAAIFLRDLYNLYGDWALVLAAYNCGPGNVNKAIHRSGKNDFWEIYAHLPRETRGYVPAYIAAVYLMEYYDIHEIVPKKPKLNLFTDTVGVSEKLHLKQVSEVLEIPYDELKALNPQYRRDILPGDQTYFLRLPFSYIGPFIDKEQEIYEYNDSIYFGDGRIVVSPPSYTYRSSASEYVPTSVEGRTKLVYTIKAGDTYGFIAGLYNVRVNDLQHWNGVRSNRLQIGQKIAVWVPSEQVGKYKHINSMSEHQRKKLKGSSSVSSAASGSSGSSSRFSKPNDNRYVWHQVRSGENLWTIAQKYSGVTDKSIKQLNGFSRRDVETLQVGQYIKIKRK